MTISNKGLSIIKNFEGLRLDAYPDPATGNEPYTIGYGSTLYSDGKKIKLGDKVTRERAEELLKWECLKKGNALNTLLMNTVVNQNQFDALLSFMYNCGYENLRTSTLIKKVRNNPSDPTIHDEFLKWINANGKPFPGLKRRRQEEWELYNTPVQ